MSIITRNIKEDDELVRDFISNNENEIEQPTKECIHRLCEHLHLPFNKEIVIALIYGDNQNVPERILPEWLSDLA